MELAKNQDVLPSVEPVPPKARMKAVAVASTRAIWDRLGLLIAVSITWALIVSLPLSADRWVPRAIPLPLHMLLLCIIPLVAAVPTAGIYSIVHRMAMHEEAFYAHLWQDGVSMAGAAIRLALFQTVSMAILIVAAMFYSRIPGLIGRVGITACGYAFLLWAMMAVYQWPCLIAQEKGVFDESDRLGKRGALASVRRSFFIALGRPFFTLALVIILAVLSALMAATIVMPALLWIGVVAVIQTFASRALLSEFGVIAPPVQAEIVPDLQFRIKQRSL